MFKGSFSRTGPRREGSLEATSDWKAGQSWRRRRAHHRPSPQHVAFVRYALPGVCSVFSHFSSSSSRQHHVLFVSFGHHSHAHTRLFHGTVITPRITPDGACRKSDAVSETTTGRRAEACRTNEMHSRISPLCRRSTHDRCLRELHTCVLRLDERIPSSKMAQRVFGSLPQ
jgi:hypothetical protein